MTVQDVTEYFSIFCF